MGLKGRGHCRGERAPAGGLARAGPCPRWERVRLSGCPGRGLPADCGGREPGFSGSQPAHPAQPRPVPGTASIPVLWPGWLAVTEGPAGRKVGGSRSAPPSLLTWAVQEAEGRDSWGQGLKGHMGVGEPPPTAQPVGEAQLLVAQVSARTPPPDAAEMALPSCRLLPGPWSPGQGSWAVGACGGRPTQGSARPGTRPRPGTWRVRVGVRGPHHVTPLGTRAGWWRPSHRPQPPCPCAPGAGSVPSGWPWAGGSPGRAVALSLSKNKFPWRCRHGSGTADVTPARRPLGSGKGPWGPGRGLEGLGASDGCVPVRPVLGPGRGGAAW